MVVAVDSHQIMAAAGIDGVFAFAHRDRVVTASRVDGVGAIAGGDRIGAAAAPDQVVAITDDNRIVAASRVDVRGKAGVIDDAVVAASADDMDTFNIRRRERLLLPIRRHHNLVALVADVDVVVELIAFDV